MKPQKDELLTYHDQTYRLLESPVRLKTEEDEIGCRFSARAVRTADGTPCTLFWNSTPVFDMKMMQIEEIRRSIDLCEYVSEEELYRRVGALEYLDSDDRICKWDQPSACLAP